MVDGKEGKNKIDAVIDEVIESKRLRQAFGFFFKAAVGLLIISFIFLIVGVATGIVS